VQHPAERQGPFVNTRCAAKDLYLPRQLIQDAVGDAAQSAVWLIGPVQIVLVVKCTGLGADMFIGITRRVDERDVKLGAKQRIEITGLLRRQKLDRDRGDDPMPFSAPCCALAWQETDQDEEQHPADEHHQDHQEAPNPAGSYARQHDR
jgi:hypothetical protein